MIGKLKNGNLIHLGKCFYDTDGNEYEWEELVAFGTLKLQAEVQLYDDTSLADVKFSDSKNINTLLHTALRSNDIYTIGDLLATPLTKIQKFNNLGRLSFSELKYWIEDYRKQMK